MNRNIVFYLFGLLALGLIACSVPQIMVDENLQADTALYNVKGRQGWLVNQHLSFGDYRTGKVDRSWTKGYDIPFIIRFSGAKEKLSFTLQDAVGDKADVFCLGKLREQDLLIFHKYFDINIKAKDAFTGSVAIGERNSFDFYVTNLNQNNWFREAEGWIKGEDLTISIQPIKHLEGGKRMLDMQAPGFSFVRDGKTLGAVEVLNQGRIWIKNDLPGEEKLLLAGVASALLLRSELGAHNEHI
ncbi:MAG: hypothetical protein DHS20C18_38260 [Saprospiraceae bacterium]|nr:MAG: hypothetical protein DHS20C18_38260 [Saprospiraceae bacterium]